ncbi:MAG: hypothetical protein RIR68_2291, partial [Pseudomonadota bacterium]
HPCEVRIRSHNFEDRTHEVTRRRHASRSLINPRITINLVCVTEGRRETGALLLYSHTMNMQRINNFRMGGYLLLAVGLINLRYQTGQDDNLAKSLTLVIPGALLLA